MILCFHTFLYDETLSEDSLKDKIDMLKQLEQNMRIYDHRNNNKEKAAQMFQNFWKIRVTFV